MKKKILIVDDEKVSRALISKQLKHKGFDVVEIESGEACIAYLRGNVADLILLDIMMPGISGIGVLKCLREKFSLIELPIIMVTGVTEEKDTIEAINFGANDYVTKPINIKVLLARINTQLQLTDLNKKSLHLKEIESINAMIVTYNHEINNPLCLLMAIISKESQKNKNLDKAQKSIEKISSILRKINEITDDKITYLDYGIKSKMIDIKKDAS